MNDNVSAIQTIAQDAINSETAMMSVDMSTRMIERVDPSRYSIQPSRMLSTNKEFWEGLRQVARSNYDQYLNRERGGRADRAEELIHIRLEEAIRQIHMLEERIYRESTSASAMASQLNALQTTVAQQTEAMQILAAEIDELKSGQLEPLEDME